MTKLKVLLVSMGNLHFFRWCEVLNEEEIDYYWFDVLDGGSYASRNNHINQIYGWKYRVKYPFRYFIKKNLTSLYRFIRILNDRNTHQVFKKFLKEIKPDIVHSFELFIACEPIAELMSTNKIPWIYSSWGSDVFYAAKHEQTKTTLSSILKRIDYLITDCERDFEICVQQGFAGKYLGVIPGGTGIDDDLIQVDLQKWNDRKIILIKGYQGKYGRCIEVLKALNNLSNHLTNDHVVVFSAHDEVVQFIKNTKLNINIRYNVGLHYNELIKTMQQSWLYIGNSISDGIPNTLIETALCGCIPVQSNPGNASAELIIDGYNGFLINDAEDPTEIQGVISRALAQKDDFSEGIAYNTTQLRLKYNRSNIAQKINELYKELLIDVR